MVHGGPAAAVVLVSERVAIRSPPILLPSWQEGLDAFVAALRGD
jgi:hypothetical protein